MLVWKLSRRSSRRALGCRIEWAKILSSAADTDAVISSIHTGHPLVQRVAAGQSSRARHLRQRIRMEQCPSHLTKVPACLPLFLLTPPTVSSLSRMASFKSFLERETILIATTTDGM